MNKIKVLFAGESWFYCKTETKGVDQFSVSGYETEIERVRSFTKEYAEIEHVPAHMVMEGFPETLEELKKYDLVIISDVGANSFLLPPRTFLNSEESPNKLQLIADYVADGGAFGMMGGYLSYMGFEAKGAYKRTAIEEILPVTMLEGDDREEHPEGFAFDMVKGAEEFLVGCNEKWGRLLGYNKLQIKDRGKIVLEYNNDPILALGEYGNGRVFAWASDCAPHWMPQEFCESANNKALWKNVFYWCAKKDEA